MPSSERGIWVDAGTGPSGEPLVCVIDSRHHRLLQGVIPYDMNRDQFVEALGVFLDTIDTIDASSAVAQPPVSRRIVRRQARGRPVRLRVVS